MSFINSLIIFTSINIISVLGVFLITGLTGLFSLGQGAFMAVGGYTAGILVTKAGLPFPIAIIAAIVAGIIFGLIVGLPTVRLRRDYIALVTFGFGEALVAILNNTAQVTGGAMGLVGIPKKTTIWLAIASAIISIFLVVTFRNSKFGRQAMALKNDELSSKAVGINVSRIKLITFLFASALTSYAGVLYGFYTTYLDPGLFGWTKSAEWIIIVFFGGVNSLTGAIFAAIFLGTLPEVLRFAAEWRIVIYSIIVLFILNFRPAGIFGEYELNIKSLKELLIKISNFLRRLESIGWVIRNKGCFKKFWRS